MRLVGKSQTLSNFNQNSKENNSCTSYTYVNNQECNEDRKYTYNCLNTNHEKKEETNTTCEMLKDNILSVPSKMCSSLLNVKCRRVFYPSNANHKMEESKDLKTKPCESKTEENSERYSNSELQNTEPQITKKNNILDTINLSIPSLIVEIISIKEGVNYQLEVTDLKRVFSKFGPVSDVNIIGDSKTKAIILMEDLSHGRQAEKMT